MVKYMSCYDVAVSNALTLKHKAIEWIWVEKKSYEIDWQSNSLLSCKWNLAMDYTFDTKKVRNRFRFEKVFDHLNVRILQTKVISLWIQKKSSKVKTRAFSSLLKKEIAIKHLFDFIVSHHLLRINWCNNANQKLFS